MYAFDLTWYFCLLRRRNNNVGERQTNYPPSRCLQGLCFLSTVPRNKRKETKKILDLFILVVPFLHRYIYASLGHAGEHACTGIRRDRPEHRAWGQGNTFKIVKIVKFLHPFLFFFQSQTFKWRGKPIFVKHRTPEEVFEFLFLFCYAIDYWSPESAAS